MGIKLLSLWAFFGGQLLGATAVSAQSGSEVQPAPQPERQAHSDVGVGDIIVTARRRQESILRVPVTETVFSAPQLQRSQINDIDHIVSRVPGLGIGQQVATIGAQISVRGVGTTTLDAGVDQSVSLNIDGLQLSQGLAFRSGLFDLAQAEVLKGPQSLYYGKNNTAGVIALHTADPGTDLEVIGRTAYEAEGKEWRTEGIVSGPVTPTLGLRLAAAYSDYKGYYYNRAVATPGLGGVTPRHDRLGGDASVIVRGTAVFKPSPDFEARFKANYTSDAGPGPAAQFVSCPDGTGPLTRPPVAFLNGDCKLDRNGAIVDLDPAAYPGIYNGGRQSYRQRQGFGTLELRYRPADALAVTSITGYYHVRSRTLFNGVQSADATALASDNTYRRHDLTQEIRVDSSYGGPINFLVGGFYQDGHVANLIRLKTNVLLNALFRLPFPASLFNGGSVLGIKAYSGFGQLRWKPAATLELAGGVRYTDERRNDTVTRYALNADFTNGAATDIPIATPTIHSRTWSPELTLTYTPTDTLTLYGSAKQGYKSGSFSISRIFTAPGAEPSFGDEKVRGGEVGLKTKVLDRSLFVNLAGYYYDYRGLQVGVNTDQCLVGEAPPCAAKNLTLNAGAARVYGVDLDFTFQPRTIAGLAVRGAVNWNHARFVRLQGVPCSGGETAAEGCTQLIGTLRSQDLSGIPLIRAPSWQLSGSVDYQLALSDRYGLAFGGDVQYSSRYLTQVNDRRDGDQRAYAKLNLNMALQGPGDHWEVALIANNVTDKLTTGNTAIGAYQVGSLYGAGGRDEVIAYVDRGRELWVKLTFKL